MPKRKVKFYNQLDRPDEDFREKGGGEILVDTAGHITAKQRIENIINAGINLMDYRRAQYEFEHNEEINEDYHDPTRDYNFDLSDVTQASHFIEAKKKAMAKKENNLKRIEEENREKKEEKKKGIDSDKQDSSGKDDKKVKSTEKSSS